MTSLGRQESTLVTVVISEVEVIIDVLIGIYP
jgi:hypothetical protein